MRLIPYIKAESLNSTGCNKTIPSELQTFILIILPITPGSLNWCYVHPIQRQSHHFIAFVCCVLISTHFKYVLTFGESFAVSQISVGLLVRPLSCDDMLGMPPHSWGVPLLFACMYLPTADYLQHLFYRTFITTGIWALGKRILPSTEIEDTRGHTYKGVLPSASKGSFTTLLFPAQCHVIVSTIFPDLDSMDQSLLCHPYT